MPAQTDFAEQHARHERLLERLAGRFDELERQFIEVEAKLPDFHDQNPAIECDASASAEEHPASAPSEDDRTDREPANPSVVRNSHRRPRFASKPKPR